MKTRFLSLFLLLSIGSMSAIRMSFGEQFALLKSATQAFEDGDIARARVELSQLVVVDNCACREGLDALQVHLDVAEVERAKQEGSEHRQEESQRRYSDLELRIFSARNDKLVSAERDLLIQLWEVGRQLDVKPANFSAYVVRLFQMIEFGIGGTAKKGPIVDLICCLRESSGPVQEAFRLMYYGDESGSRVVNIWPAFFDRAKRLLGQSDVADARELLELIILVGDISLRDRAQALLVGNSDPQDRVSACGVLAFLGDNTCLGDDPLPLSADEEARVVEDAMSVSGFRAPSPARTEEVEAAVPVAGAALSGTLSRPDSERLFVEINTLMEAGSYSDAREWLDLLIKNASDEETRQVAQAMHSSCPVERENARISPDFMQLPLGDRMSSYLDTAGGCSVGAFSLAADGGDSEAADQLSQLFGD